MRNLTITSQNGLFQKKIGGAGIWTQDIPHAKRTLYHWATPPLLTIVVEYFRPEAD